MNKFITLAVSAAMIAGSVATVHAGCTLFQHRDYGGARKNLGHFDRVKMVRGESIGCTTNGHGDGCESTLYDHTWNDHVSSWKLTNGCRLTVWEDVNEGGAWWRTSKSYRYVGGDWNDEVSEALCMC
jgi:hypothetical protein